MKYKKHFTDKELSDLLAWFDAHENALPQSIVVDKALYIKDLRYTLRLYRDIVAEHKDNPTYSGQIYLLFKIKKTLEDSSLPNA